MDSMLDSQYTHFNNYEKETCRDCGVKGCIVWHSGHLVPKYGAGSFCSKCWQERLEYFLNYNEPKIVYYFGSNSIGASIKVIADNGCPFVPLSQLAKDLSELMTTLESFIQWWRLQEELSSMDLRELEVLSEASKLFKQSIDREFHIA